MGLTYKELTHGERMWVSDRRLYLDRDGNVSASPGESLLVAEGGSLPLSDAERYGLIEVEIRKNPDSPHEIICRQINAETQDVKPAANKAVRTRSRKPKTETK